ncbi:DUF4333 domain-containing protein [Aldersonia kunmingensis]|uniref:DUF4333 domain-containing protein n=1 Tax=Aldersonia kunmingensis TaxID=408066 RepID=UPI00083469B8|nr:DUF4333 domain-containing protein [Aldersonia kunmingensis]
MSDPREPEDANSPWARPGQPSPETPESSSSEHPEQQAWEPDATQQAYEPQQWPGQQNWPQQQWQPQPQQPGWQGGPYQQGQPYPQGQPYQQQWAPQPGQQYYYQGQPYGAAPQQAYGEVPPMPTDTQKRSRAPLFIGLGVLVVIIGVVAGVFFAGGTTLDQEAAQIGVAQILTNSYGLENVTDVSCPSGQQVKENDSFICTVLIDGESRDVAVTFVDDDGTYEVGRPL